jgi:MurNAc alpha-1-phosphate uridylyltransferase
MPPEASPSPRAIVLAAGRGERMRPLSDHTPKPLLELHGQPLVAHHLLALARDGVAEAVVNTAWLEEQFAARLGDGSAFGLQLSYSHEGALYGGALETAGGIATVLPWLSEGGRAVFWVVSGDIWSPDFVFDADLTRRFAASDLDALLWLVPNPPYHAKGDFGLGLPRPDLAACAALGTSNLNPSAGGPSLTYANLALMKPAFLQHLPAGQRAALGPLLHQAMALGRVAVLAYDGRWANVGTPADLAALQEQPHPPPRIPGSPAQR